MTRTLVKFLAIVLAAVACAPAMAQTPQKKPNILVIWGDDIGYLFAALEWVPTSVDIAGGPKGDELKEQIEADTYRYRQDDPRRRQSARAARGQDRQVGAQLLPLLLRSHVVGRPLQELADVLQHVAARTGPLDHAARALPLHAGR